MSEKIHKLFSLLLMTTLMLVSLSQTAFAVSEKPVVSVSSARGSDELLITVNGSGLENVRAVQLQLNYNEKLFTNVEIDESTQLKDFANGDGLCLSECRAEGGKAVMLIASQNVLEGVTELFTIKFTPKTKASGGAILEAVTDGNNAFMLSDINKEVLDAELSGEALRVDEGDFGIGLEGFIKGAEAKPGVNITPLLIIAAVALNLVAVAVAVRKHFVNKK